MVIILLIKCHFKNTLNLSKICMQKLRLKKLLVPLWLNEYFCRIQQYRIFCKWETCQPNNFVLLLRHSQNSLENKGIIRTIDAKNFM